MKPVYPNYVSPSIASKIFGCTSQTLRRWAKAGTIDSIKTPGGQYRYDVSKFTTPMSLMLAKVETINKPAKPKRETPTVTVDLGDVVKKAPQALPGLIDMAALRTQIEALASQNPR